MGSTSKIFSALSVKQTVAESELGKIQGSEDRLVTQQIILKESAADADNKINTWIPAKPSPMLKNCFMHREKASQAVTISAHRAKTLAETKREVQSQIRRYSGQRDVLFNQHQLRALGEEKKREQHETDELNMTSAHKAGA